MLPLSTFVCSSSSLPSLSCTRTAECFVEEGLSSSSHTSHISYTPLFPCSSLPNSCMYIHGGCRQQYKSCSSASMSEPSPSTTCWSPMLASSKSLKLFSERLAKGYLVHWFWGNAPQWVIHIIMVSSFASSQACVIHQLTATSSTCMYTFTIIDVMWSVVSSCANMCSNNSHC